MAHKTTSFLASSSELKAERGAFEARIYRKNKLWHEAGIFLHLDVWEDYIDAMSRTRPQNEYNVAIRAADVFVLLVHTKAGKYSAEEFEVAHAQFKATGKPLIYTYFKNPSGPGALAQGSGAQAVAAGGVAIGGNNTAPINTGTQTNIHTGGGSYVGGNVSVQGGDFVGRDKVTHSGTPGDLAGVFTALLAALDKQAEPAAKALAAEQVAVIQAEVTLRAPHFAAGLGDHQLVTSLCPGARNACAA